MNVMGWVLDLEVNLPNPSAHQVNVLICCEICDCLPILNLKFILLGRLNVKVSNKSFIKINLLNE